MTPASMTDAGKTGIPRLTLQVSPTAECGNASQESLKVKKEEDNCPDEVVQRVVLHESSFDDDDSAFHRPGRVATFALAATALIILAWWISSLVLPMTRPRWLPQTLLAWFFVLVIAFRFIPASLVSRPIAAIWHPTVGSTITHIPYRGRLALAWLCVLGITFGSAFGSERPTGTSMADRAISLAGVFFFQLVIYAHSMDRNNIDWGRIPASIFLQQAIALFVLKSSVGFTIFGFLSTIMAGLQSGALEAAQLIFDQEVVEKQWLLVLELGGAIFVAALVQMLYWFGWMQWLTKQFAWFGSRVFGASGAETIVAIFTPWFGQVNSALIVGPYIESMTDSEIFALMATSMASISSPMVSGYTKLGATPRNLIAQSAILIPGAIMTAKGVYPEPVPEIVTTRSRSSMQAYKKDDPTRKVEILDALEQGAWLGLRVAGRALASLFMLFALFGALFPFFIWVFRGFGVKQYDAHPVVAATLTPFTFFLGVPRNEVWKISLLLSHRVLEGSTAGFAALAKLMSSSLPLSSRGFQVAQVALAGSASMPSMGLQMGAMAALASGRTRLIARTVMPALVIALFSNFQAAAIAATVL